MARFSTRALSDSRRGIRRSRATTIRWPARAWLLAGCLCLSLDARAQEAEPIAPPPASSIPSPTPTPAPIPTPPRADGDAPSAPAPRTADGPASAETPAKDLAGSAPVSATAVEAAAADRSVEGLASYYARKFTGRRTASGEVFNPKALTMAHRSWPFGTAVRVTHLLTGRSVVVRVNDRGPHVRQRLADLSPAAARALGMLHEGITRVRLEVLPSAGAGR